MGIINKHFQFSLSFRTIIHPYSIALDGTNHNKNATLVDFVQLE